MISDIGPVVWNSGITLAPLEAGIQVLPAGLVFLAMNPRSNWRMSFLLGQAVPCWLAILLAIYFVFSEMPPDPKCWPLRGHAWPKGSTV